MLRASTLAWRTACCAFGAQNSPGRLRSGTAAMSPAANTPGTPMTARSAPTSIRPTGSVGRPDAAPLQRTQRPQAELLIQLGQDPPGRLDQYPAQLVGVQRRVEPDRLVGEP